MIKEIDILILKQVSNLESIDYKGKYFIYLFLYFKSPCYQERKCKEDKDSFDYATPNPVNG